MVFVDANLEKWVLHPQNRFMQPLMLWLLAARVVLTIEPSIGMFLVQLQRTC